MTIRYFAGARHAAGTEEEQWPIAEALALAQLVIQLGDAQQAQRPELASVLARCSFLVNETAVTDKNQLVVDGDTVDALPPFAGG
ncbi:MAG: molybdopterin synthase sulfur carrier subunit [Acidimicrobiales bacterium]|nr:MAG: molybdopterin synthase sulfur carrier subunit [Acidimicrobiales bacterium]